MGQQAVNKILEALSHCVIPDGATILVNNWAYGIQVAVILQSGHHREGLFSDFDLSAEQYATLITEMVAELVYSLQPSEGRSVIEDLRDLLKRYDEEEK